MSDEIIRKALGMGAEPTIEENAVAVYEGPEIEDQIERDFDYIRENLVELIAQGQEAISELMLIAKQSQHPRAFEVIATLLKATADINNDLAASHKKKLDLKPDRAQHTKGSSVTNNNLFVGSTAELQHFLDQQKKLNG